MDTTIINDGKDVDINDSKTKNTCDESTNIDEREIGKTEQYASNNINVSSSEQLSSVSSSSSGEVASSLTTPPDGGWGWVVVFASFMINLIADGVSLSFGILFVDLVQYFGESKAKTSWVGSIFLSMPLLAGPIASYLADRYGCQKVCIAGALLATIAFIASAFANSLEVLFLTFSIGGLGLALCYVTSIVIVAYYFEKKRSLATGLAACGTGIGTFIFPPFTIYLLEEYGWRGTLLILSGFFLNMIAFGALMRDLECPTGKNNSEDKRYSDTDNSGHENCTLEDSERLCSSLVQLPTYLCDNLPFEVISELSSKEGGYLNSLLEQHPYLLNSIVVTNEKDPPISPPSSAPLVSSVRNKTKFRQNLLDSKFGDKYIPNQIRKDSAALKLDAAYLRNMRVQRGSITYRGAMLNIRRYRLRASSCPDIYRNSMVTISEEKTCLCFQDMKGLLLDMFDFSIFKNAQYALFCVSNFLLYACVDVPYVYIPDHAYNQGVDMESASFLISVLGVLNTLGVVIVGYVGDKPWIDSSLLYSAFITISGLMLAIVPLIKDYYGVASLVGIYGFTISANYTLVPVIIVNLISLDCFTGAYGLLLLVQGVASLVGPPLAGMLFDMTGNYDITFFCTGVCIMMSGVMVIPVAKTLLCTTEGSSIISSKESEKQTPRSEKVRFKESVNEDGDRKRNSSKICQSNKLKVSLSFETCKNNENAVTVPLICNVNKISSEITENSALVEAPRPKTVSIYENPLSAD